MKNKVGNYVLHCGELKYEITPEVQKTLEAVMYWEHCLRLDSAELQGAEKNKRESEREDRKPAYTEEEINELRHAVEQERLSCGDFMKKMEEQGVPNWVGNGAMEWARNNDLRQHSTREFFEKSVYARNDKAVQNVRE